MIETINPATEAVLERIPYMEPSEVEARLAAAARAARQWRSTALGERAAVLTAIAASMRTECDSLAATAVREMGKPIRQARAEVEKCAWTLEYFAHHTEAMLAPRETASNAARSYVAFRPLGVVLAIMPWNFPYWQVIRAIAPALMAGNVVLLKHATNTTRCALELERIANAAGLPNGVFGVLLVTNEDADALIADERVAATTLTGSERAGVAVGAASGHALKKCVLELGGSDAFVVLADADLDAAARAAVRSRFQNNGESCIAGKRFIVERRVYGDFLARFVELSGGQTVGDPMNEEVALGPCARADLRETLDEQVRRTVDAGARIALGGKRLDRRGYFYAATIVENVRPGMRMFDEEVFGPAAAVVAAENADEAITLANQSDFGLGFSLWTGDVDAVEDIVARAEAGSVFVNSIVASDPRLPFGGIKKSGYGRELSTFGITEFTNVQTVSIA